MKKATVLCWVMIVLMMVSCAAPIANTTQPATAKPTDQPVVKESSAAASATATTSEETEFQKYYSKADPVIPLTQNMKSGDPNVVWEAGDSIENNNFTRWAERAVGIKWSVKWNAVTQEEDTQKLTMAMAANDLPLFIRAYTSSEVMKMAGAGQIIPLNDPIDQYLSPLSKYMLQEMNNATQGMHFKMNYFQGKLYALGSYADMVTPRVNWWRQDILTELGFKTPPKTIQEVDAVFAAYKAKYPDGICINLDKDLQVGVEAVFLAYGSQVKSWRKMDDNTLQYAPAQPQTKEALAKLADWYKKGYIDPEFIVKDTTKATEAWTSGNSIFRQREWWACWGDHITLQANVKTALVTAGDYWVGPTGEWGSRQIKPNEFEQYCISSKASPEAIKAIMTQFNFFCDSAFRAHKDLRDKFSFVYPYEDEKNAINQKEVGDAQKAGEKRIPRLKFDIPADREGPSNGQNSWMAVTVAQGEQFGFRFNQRPGQLRADFLTVENLVKNNDQTALGKNTIYLGLKDAWSPNNLNSLFEAIHIAQKSEAENHTYFDMQWCPATATQLQKGAYLLKIEDSAFAKIIMGEQPIDTFDTFVKDWKANGGDQITNEINAWWDTVK
jgi:putative aldouronate transport system substrate-binding protein